jgi:hypothetical protein
MLHRDSNKNKIINLLQDNGKHTTLGSRVVFIAGIIYIYIYTRSGTVVLIWLISGPGLGSVFVVHVDRSGKKHTYAWKPLLEDSLVIIILIINILKHNFG